MTEPRIIATIDARNGYNGLIEGFRKHFGELNVGLEDVDERAGLPLRYTAKLLAHLKDLGRVSLGPLLGAGGLKLLLVVDPEADVSILRQRGTRGPKLAKADANTVKSRKCRMARAKFLLTSSSSQRSNAARMAADARWGPHRKRKAKLARRRELRRKLMEAAVK